MPRTGSLPPELQEILSSKKLRDDLISYASESFCEENVLFLEEVLDFKQKQSPKLVSQIVAKYIRPDSPCQVNIDSHLQGKILEAVKRMDPAQPDFTIFDEAFTHVSELVLSDTVTKMKGSNLTPLERAATADKNKTSLLRVIRDDGEVRTWFRGHLLRRQGFFSQWKAFTYMKKGNYLFEFKAGANHVKSTPLLTIPLEGSLTETAKTITGKDFSFILHSQDGKSYFFRASSQEEMEEWLNELSGASSFKMKRSKTISSSASVHHSIASASSSPSSPSTPTSASSSAVPPPSYAPPSYTYTPSPLPPGPISSEEALSELAKALPILNFLESFTDAVVVSDAAGLVVATNSAAERMFRYTKQELRGMPLKALMPEPYRSMHDAYMFRHEKFGDEKLIGKTRNLQATRRGEEVFNVQLSLGKLPIKGFFIGTLRER